MEAMANVKYEHFRIVKYKAILTPIVIPLKHNVIPIIGVNECGKTTILKGIFAFDFRNDEVIPDKSHIHSVRNLYKVNDPDPCIIEAEILLDQESFKDAVETFQKARNNLGAVVFSDKFIDWAKTSNLKSIVIQRVLNGNLIYQIDQEVFTAEDKDCVDAFCKHIIKYLPRMMFFDDFNDKIPEKIEISLNNPSYNGWSGMFLRLFESATEGMSLKDLFNSEVVIINSAISDINKRLEETIAKEWTGMKLTDEKGQALGFQIDCKYNPAVETACFTIQVVETVKGAERFFTLPSRSKGFCWFFNFVMKLMFNPNQSIHENNQVIFLLDEPGSYLHVSAQKELCKKLATLANATIIYCTHSHNLLHPEHIKLSSIKICGKEANGNIRLFTPYDYDSPNMYAFQPIYDALGMREDFLMGIEKLVVLVEGITDFYSFDMFKSKQHPLSFFPCVNANSINYIVPIFLSAGRNFICLRDGDQEGKKHHNRLMQDFQEEMATLSLTLDQIDCRFKNLEDLYDKAEVATIASALNSSGEVKKLIAKLYFHPERSSLIAKMPKTTATFTKAIEFFMQKYDRRNEILD